MHTLGVDLASVYENIAAWRIDWSASPATVEVFERVGDDQLGALILNADKAGLDIPLGWPDEFVEFVSAHQAGRQLPDVDRARLRLRETDRAVHAACGRWPLSVSADRIAIPTMRAAVLKAGLPSVTNPLIGRSGRVLLQAPKPYELPSCSTFVRHGPDLGHASRLDPSARPGLASPHRCLDLQALALGG